MRFFSVLCWTVTLLAVQGWSKPLDDIQDNEILAVSTIVNGITKDELPALLNQLDKIKLAIKAQAFETMQEEVARKGVSVDKTKTIIDVVARILDESLIGLSQVRAKVNLIAKSSRSLSEEESIFLTNVRQSLPDILDFTATQFNLVRQLF